jgi:phosphoheptose isomerase
MERINLSKVTTYPIAIRVNLVNLKDLVQPETPAPSFQSSDLDKVVASIIVARDKGRPVIWMMGAHVIKSGLSLLIIDLMRRGFITHVAGNGAVSIHDFELALIGATSEDVASSLEDGTFGMADETGALIHKALRQGVWDGLGYGTAIGRFIEEHPESFPHREVSVLYQAYKLNIPATIHVTLGADIIHQHPDVNFTIIGTTSGRDFKRFATSVCDLDEGVFLNFGSAVTGPEVFLKSLTIAHNLGHPTTRLTTANFDLLPVPNIDRPMGYEEPLYYYRPRKNIVLRPTAHGGHGYHITGDHRVTIPNLYHRILSAKKTMSVQHQADSNTLNQNDFPRKISTLVEDLLVRQPSLKDVVPYLLRAFRMLSACFQSGGTLFLCGNGGSMSDALHISGELLKSYANRRKMPEYLHKILSSQPDGQILTRNLEPGLRTVVLGANPSISSAVANDMQDRNMEFAQELFALARPGDVLMGLSTSGNARNVILTAQTAHALGLQVIGLTSKSGGKLAEFADALLCMPVSRTDRVQEYHVLCYHVLCEMLERHFYGDE